MSSENWRFIDLDIVELEELYGIEEAIARSEGPPTILFWRANKLVLTVGYFQRVESELNLRKCRGLGLQIVRRITGGGAVLIGPDIPAYSLVVNEKNPFMPSGIEESYGVICKGIVEALRRMGLNAQFSPVNGMLIDEKKISVSFQTRAWGKIIQHGFVNLVLNLPVFQSILNMPEEKLHGEVLPLEDKFTWIDKEMLKIGKFPVSHAKLKSYLKYGLELIFKTKLILGELTPDEKEKAKIYARKFYQNNWNYRPKPFQGY